MNEERLRDDALVVRGGYVTPERVQDAADDEPTWGISVQSANGLTAEQLAREGAVPHRAISVTTAGQIRAIGAGFDVRPTQGPGRHATIIIPSRPVSDDARAIAAVFGEPVANPAR